MTKVNKKTKHSNIDSNIQKAFKVIDDYLPKHYTREVKELVPEVSENHIRAIKCNRKGNARVIAALLKVATHHKNLF